MQFTVTTIRLNSNTKEFQNTETNNFLLCEEVVKELERINCDDEQFEKFFSMKRGENITIETVDEDENKLRFCYIFRVS